MLESSEIPQSYYYNHPGSSYRRADIYHKKQEIKFPIFENEKGFYRLHNIMNIFQLNNENRAFVFQKS